MTVVLLAITTAEDVDVDDLARGVANQLKPALVTALEYDPVAGRIQHDRISTFPQAPA